MKLNTSILLIISAFIIITSLCMCMNNAVEGLNTMRKNTHVLNRGEYMDDVGYLKSKDGNYTLVLRKGLLKCLKKNRRVHWTMNTKGSKIMLLNEHGILQFKKSKEAEYIPIQKSQNANSLVLTSYGTLELKSRINGAGNTLWTYPVNEGFTTPDDADLAVMDLITAIDSNSSNLTKHTVKNLDNHFTKEPTMGTNDNLNVGLNTRWSTFKTTVYDSAQLNGDFVKTSVDSGLNINNDIITGGNHNTLLRNNNRLKKLRSELDNKVQLLNQLSDSHVSEKQLHLDSTIYISLVWTVIASSLVYFTFTQ